MTISKSRMSVAGFTLLLTAVSCLADDLNQDAEHWFRQGYGFVFAEDHWENVDEVAQYFAPVIELRALDGETREVGSRDYLEQAISGWKAGDLVGSDLVALRPSTVSQSEVLFKVRWVDRYLDGSQEYSCGVYEARLTEGKWQFVVWGEAVCSEP
jgi:hypothetical protein